MSKTTSYAIIAKDDDSLSCAKHIAQLTPHFHIVEKRDFSTWCLLIEKGTLTLLSPEDSLPSLSINFDDEKLTYRRKHGGGKKQALAKAIGIKSTPYPTVLDATAGLARDAFILASLGCQVTLYERNPLLFTLLNDAIYQAQHSIDDELVGISQRMDAAQYDILALSGKKTEKFDIVYLDPMFPEKKNSAKVKKEMQILQSLIGKDLDADLLLEAAKKVARKRIVVKRPKQAPFLNNERPSHQLIGKSNRFDIYMVSS